MDKVSEMEQQKIYESIRLSLKGTHFQPKIAEEAPDKERQNIVDKVIKYVEDQKLSEFLNIMVEENKVRIILAQPVLFDTGKAELKETAMELLADIGKMLLSAKNPIIVEGHTDNVPIHTAQYDSNWELSFGRAYSVIKYLIKGVGLSPVRMHAIGYGEYRPIAPNDTDENRAKNRRIEINILLKEVFVASGKNNEE